MVTKLFRENKKKNGINCMVYLRKFGKAYNVEKIKETNEISDIDAEFIKHELIGTPDSPNELSFWFCENEDKLLDVEKAILLSGNSIDKVYFIKIYQKQLENEKIDIVNENGKTAYLGYENCHANIKNLDYHLIGKIGGLIIDNAKEESNILFLDKNQVKNILIEAYRNKEIEESKIDSKLFEDIKKYAK